MSGSIDELAIAYARLGLEHWNVESPRVKLKAKSIGVDIATNVDIARRAVEEPYEPDTANGDPMRLIPMPCGQRKVYAAFFAPWVASRNGPLRLSFDLVVLSQQSGPIAFRFEPGSGRTDAFHGYDHVQLSESLGGGKVKFDNPLSPLPKTYPAFPIPSEDAVTRFLALVVAMHGFPRGVDDVFGRAFKGQAKKQRRYLNLTKAMLLRKHS